MPRIQIIRPLLLFFAVAGCGPSISAPKVVELPAAKDSEVTVLAAVGDIMIGHAANKLIKAEGYDPLFAGVAPLLADADLRMGNLEAPITAHKDKASEDKKYSYKMRPKVAQVLKEQGLDLLDLANNHTLDYGLKGLQDTIKHLEEQGLLHLGAGLSEDEARRGLVLAFEGGARVGMLAYLQSFGAMRKWNWYADGDSPGLALADSKSMRADIGRMRRHADVVIVQLHFGKNYKPITTTQQRLAHAAIDAGADLVIGHHPHIAQAIELYQSKPIIYSLGNYVFNTTGRFPTLDQPGFVLVANIELSKSGIRAINIQGMFLDNRQVKFRPRPLTINETQEDLLPILEERGVSLTPQGSMLRWQLEEKQQ